jgi:predicted Fe-Mo cluster-binding NifX family protein
MIKIAIPTTGNVVDNHFGHCEMYTVITADDDLNITGTEILPSPQGCGCKSNIASVFQEIGVSVMLAGGIGAGAIQVLNLHGIGVIRGCSGEVNKLAEMYLKGALTDSGESCAQHEHHHQEGHTCSH